jgi:hypothetical protein
MLRKTCRLSKNKKLRLFFNIPRKKSTKIKIFAHSLGKYMAAMVGRALVPMFLHCLQYGGNHHEGAYCKAYLDYG